MSPKLYLLVTVSALVCIPQQLRKEKWNIIPTVPRPPPSVPLPSLGLYLQRRLHDSDDSSSDSDRNDYSPQELYVGCFQDDEQSPLLEFGFISGDFTIEVREQSY